MKSINRVTLIGKIVDKTPIVESVDAVKNRVVPCCEAELNTTMKVYQNKSQTETQTHKHKLIAYDHCGRILDKIKIGYPALVAGRLVDGVVVVNLINAIK